MNFQGIVLIIATVILIICLIMIGIALRKNKEEVDYPPVMSDCPDYWDVQVDDDGIITGCKNVRELGLCNRSREGRGDLIKMSPCAKKSWAERCNVTWDGITNGRPCNKR